MDYAKVLIIDTNIELYEYSAGIWAEYGITSHRVDNIEQALEVLSVYKYHLIVIVECMEQRPAKFCQGIKRKKQKYFLEFQKKQKGVTKKAAKVKLFKIYTVPAKIKMLIRRKHKKCFRQNPLYFRCIVNNSLVNFSAENFTIPLLTR